MGLTLSEDVKEALEKLIDTQGDELSKAGILDTLNRIADPEVKFSKVIIGNARVVLEQYGVEVDLSPLQKTVLTYLLRHPFGVYARWMENDEDELTDIYGCFSVSESQKSDKAVIAALVSLNGGERKMSEQVSRINSAFKNALEKAGVGFYANSYRILCKDGLYKAAFTEDDVIWDLAY